MAVTTRKARTITLTKRGWNAAGMVPPSDRVLFRAPCVVCKVPVDVTLRGPVEHACLRVAA